MQKKRLTEFDYIKGIAIFLVVLGHIVPREAPVNDIWFMPLKRIIYSFHMPLFMFASGTVFGYSNKRIRSISGYVLYIKSKAIRLLIPYLTFAFIIFVGKVVSSYIIQVDNQVSGISDFFIVFYSPRDSFAFFLWYVYVLFIYYLISPIFLWITNNHIQYILPFFLVLHFINVPKGSIFAADQVFTYSFVFYLGVYLGGNFNKSLIILEKVGFFVMPVFILLLIWLPKEKFILFIIGILSIPSFYSFVQLKYVKKISHITLFAEYTFSIYLMHQIFIGLLKGVVFRFIPWEAGYFNLVAPFLLLLGLYGPIYAHKLIISKNVYLGYCCPK